MYWISFTIGQSADWVVYLEISKDEFYDVWDGKSSVINLHKLYLPEATDSFESARIEKKYGLREAINMHGMPPAMEQMEIRSVVPFGKNIDLQDA